MSVLPTHNKSGKQSIIKRTEYQLFPATSRDKRQHIITTWEKDIRGLAWNLDQDLFNWRKLSGPNGFKTILNRVLNLFIIHVQFWMRVPLVAPEDLRDDIIENAPTSHTEEYSGEEKTWMWYVSFCGCTWGGGKYRVEPVGRSPWGVVIGGPYVFDGLPWWLRQ